eukprot:4344084-Pleurochrysis_carterae.AAC.4
MLLSIQVKSKRANTYGDRSQLRLDSRKLPVDVAEVTPIRDVAFSDRFVEPHGREHVKRVQIWQGHPIDGQLLVNGLERGDHLRRKSANAERNESIALRYLFYRWRAESKAEYVDMLHKATAKSVTARGESQHSKGTRTDEQGG